MFIVKWILIALLTIVNILGCGGMPWESKPDPGRCYVRVALWFVHGDKQLATELWEQERDAWPYAGHVDEAYDFYAPDDDDALVYYVRGDTAKLWELQDKGFMVAPVYQVDADNWHTRWMEWHEDMSRYALDGAWVCEY